MNKSFMGLLPVVLILLVQTVIGFPQEKEGAQQDAWHNLTIDVATPDDAMKILGQPTKDSVENLEIVRLGKWLTPTQKQKVFHRLDYKGTIQGFEAVRLSFLKDKLVLIQLEFSKKIPPDSLANIYGVEFEPVLRNSDTFFSSDYQVKGGENRPKNYPSEYSVVAKTQKTFIQGVVHNFTVGDVFGGRTTPDHFPGKVISLHIISRTLENREGLDVLK